MPTYEYECKKCGHHFEMLQKMTDKPAGKCPKCSGAVKRLMGSGVGFIFKGSGFYHTDYKAKTSNKPTCPKKDKNNPSCGSCSA